MAIRIDHIERAGETRQKGSLKRLARATSLIAAALILAGPLCACAPKAAATSEQATLGDAGPGGPFTLVDQDGRTVDQSILDGKWSIVFFGYTFCPDVCPTTLTALGQAMTDLGPEAKKVQVVFITVDPARDTPSQLKTYLSSKPFPKNMIGLTGTPAQIAKVAKEYVVYYEKEGTGPNYTMDHSTALYLMDPAGKFHSVMADGLPPKTEARQIAKAISGT